MKELIVTDTTRHTTIRIEAPDVDGEIRIVSHDEMGGSTEMYVTLDAAKRIITFLQSNL